MKRIVSHVCSLLTASLVCSPAPAACEVQLLRRRAEMVKSLAEKFKENPAAVGVVNPSAVIEVFVSADGTWTILATGTDGKSCVLSAGDGWEINVLAMAKALTCGRHQLHRVQHAAIACGGLRMSRSSAISRSASLPAPSSSPSRIARISAT